MPLDIKCCVVVPLKCGVQVVGALTVIFSAFGLILTALDESKVLPRAENRLIRWMLENLFIYGIQGIVFYALLLTCAILLLYGAAQDIPPLLIPFVAYTPAYLIGVYVNLALVIKHEPSSGHLPKIFVDIVIFFFSIYFSVIVTAFYQERSQIVYEMVARGERAPSRLRRFLQWFQRNRNQTRGTPEASSPPDPPQGSTEPLTRAPDNADMRNILSLYYARLLMTWQSRKGQPARPSNVPSTEAIRRQSA